MIHFIYKISFLGFKLSTAGIILIYYLEFWSNISNKKKSVSSDIQTLSSGLKKQGAAQFLTKFKVFGYLIKHSFECLIWLLKALIILGKNQSKTSQNFMIIWVIYPNLLHGIDFLCFLFMHEVLMNLRMIKLMIQLPVIFLKGSLAQPLPQGS